MKIRALIICEDVRLEVGGTVSLIGVFNDRIIVDPGEEREAPLQIPRLAFVGIVQDLRGMDRVRFRFRIRRDADPDPPGVAFAAEAHQPDANEHNYVVMNAPMVFPGPGAYEAIFEAEAKGERLELRYRFYLDLKTAP